MRLVYDQVYGLNWRPGSVVYYCWGRTIMFAKLKEKV